MDETRSEPLSLRAGDSADWSRELLDYPAADGWSLKYRLLWPSGPSVAISTIASGTTYSVALTSADTLGYPAGLATLVAYVENSITLARVTLDSLAITILPDLVAAPSHDGRSDNEIALANARAALASYMAKGQVHVAEYDIGGRTMKFRTAAEIRELIGYYEAEVARETAVKNGTQSRRVLIGFANG